MVLGKRGAGDCVSGSLPVDSSAGYRWRLRTPLARSVSLWDCFRNRKFIQPLSQKAQDWSSVQPFNQGTDRLFFWQGQSCCSIANEQLDSQGIFWQFLDSINSAVQTNERHHFFQTGPEHRGQRLCTHKHSRGKPFVSLTCRNVVQVHAAAKVEQLQGSHKYKAHSVTTNSNRFSR